MTTVAFRKSSEESQRRLKAELQQLRRRGALRAGAAASEDSSASSSSSSAAGAVLVGAGRACARCRAPLGRLVNRGAPCRACRLLVCRDCRHHLERSPDWVCSVCHKHMEIQAATGEWMNEYVRRPSRRRDNRVYVPPADVVKRSIRRSWTISNPSSRWSATRGSPELRAYNSLPRHQECCYTSLNHSPREKSPSYPRDEGSPCGSPRARQPSPAHKYSLPADDPDHDNTTERPSTRSPPALDLDDRPAAASASTTSRQAGEQSPPGGAFRDRMSTSPALSARVRRQQYFSSRSDDDTEFQSRYLQNHVLRQHRQKSEDYVAGSAPEDKSSSPGSSPSVQESRLAAGRDLRDVTSSSTSHSSREVSPLARRHQSFDVPRARTVSLLQQHRHASVDRGEAVAAPAPPASPTRRYLLLGQEARHPLLAPPHRRPLLQRDYVPSALEYSGNSDSGGEVVATPPPHARRCYAAPRDDTSSLSSHKADGSPVHASSGDDFDVEPISGTVFRKVTVKKRRQETRRVLDNGRFSRRSSSRVVESVRVTEVSSHYHHRHHHHNHHGHHSHHHHHRHDPLLLAPDVDDYKLVFISSDSSSSKEDDDDEEEEEEEEDEGADEDTESSSSAGCDWDYFEQGCCGERAVEEVTLCDQHCSPPPPPPLRGGGGPSATAGPSTAAAASPWCAACGSATVLPVPVPIPVPVPFPVPFWSPAHQHHFMQDAALGVASADVVAAAGASGGGGVRIRIRNPATSSAPSAGGASRVMVGPWSCSWPAELISPLISGSTVVAVTSTGAVVQCPPAVNASTRALAAVPACEIFIRHERAEEPPAAPVAAVAEVPDRPRRDRDPLSGVDKPGVGADNADGAVPREPVTVEPVDKHHAASASDIGAADDGVQITNKDTVPTSQDPTNDAATDEAPLEPSTTSSSSPPPAEDTSATTVRFHLTDDDAKTDEPVADEEASQESDDTLERQRRALLSLPRERLHSSSSTSSSSSSTSSEACQDSEDEGAETTQVAAGCYTVTADGDSDADSDSSSSSSSGGEFSKVFVVNSGGDDDDGDDSEQSQRDDLPDAPAESAGSDAEDEEGGAGVVLLRHASFSSDEKTAEARQSALQQNKEEAVLSGGKKSSEPTVVSQVACAANEEEAENCDDGIVLLKHVKKLEAENATHDASRPDNSKGKGEDDDGQGDGIVLVKHVKKLEEESADLQTRASDVNNAPDGVDSAKEEEQAVDGSDSEESVSDEVQMHHDTGDSSDSDSDSSTSGCDSDLDSGDGGVVLLRHVEVAPEEDQEAFCVPVVGDGVSNESEVVVIESVVSDADNCVVVEEEPSVEIEKSEEAGERREEAANAEESSDSNESECKAAAVGEDTGGEKNDAGLGGNISENRDDASESKGSDLVPSQEVVEQVAEQGAVVLTPAEEAASAVCSSSGEGPPQPEVTTEETQDQQKLAGQGEDGDSTATKHDHLPVEGEVSEREVTDEESVREEVAKCVEEMAESIVAEVEETVVREEGIVEETVYLEASAGSGTEDARAEESELREGIREADEDKPAAVATGGGEPPHSWSGGVVLRRIRHLDDEGSDPALAGGGAEKYAGRAAAESSPRRSEMAPASADGAPRAAAATTTHDSEEGVRNTCISLAALFAECDSASVAVREDEVSGAESAGKEVAEVDERAAVPATGAGTSGASAPAEAPVDSEGGAGESAAEMTSGDSAPAEHAFVRDRGAEDLKTVAENVGEAAEVQSCEDAATVREGETPVNLEASEIEQPVEPDVAAHLLSPEQQSDVCRRSRSASESEGTVNLEEEEESESGEGSDDGEGARAAPAPGAPAAAAPEASAAAASVGRGSPTRADAGQHGGAPPERYTSLVMITQDAPQQSVSVVTSETTTLVPAGAAPAPGGGGDVVVRHTNWEEQAAAAAAAASGLAGYFTLTLEASPRSGSPSARRPLVTKTLPDPTPEEEASVRQQEDVHVVTGADTLSAVVCLEEGLADDDSWVEEVGDRDEDEFATSTASEGEDADDSSCDESGAAVRAASYSDREEELRGYHRSAIDFTLHTIVEESCEESEVEHLSRNGAGSGKKSRPTSASELEKYFFFRLGNGAPVNPGGAAGAGRELDSMSDTCSSIYSEGLESLGGGEDGAGGAGSPRDDADADELAALASSRLEKYFLTGFMGFMGPSGEGAGDSDGSGSVGSDSEGRPSPEQRRKRLVTRARRGHQLSVQQLASPTQQQQQQQHDVTPELSCSEAPPFSATEDSSSTETEGLGGSLGAHDDTVTTFDRPDGQFDTVKRKKKRRSSGCPSPAVEEPPQQTSISTPPSTSLDSGIPPTTTTNRESSEDEDGAKTPQPEFLLLPSDLSASRNKQHSRDSGFIGSCDDLLKEQRTSSDSSSAGGSDAPTQPPSNEPATSDTTASAQKEEPSLTQTPSADDSTQKGPVPTPAPSDEKASQPAAPPPPATSLTRKDSFNNWSSDEETNLMMSKMRAFFKTMVAAAGANSSGRASSGATSTSTPQASPGVRPRSKPPQLVYFENELTRLMKTVPGIRDDQVREIVEYLSSEDTWSDSYDSSDYTSSDLEAQHEHHHRHHQYHPYAYQPAAPPGSPAARSDLQEQISASCRQIINKFDTAGPGGSGDDVSADRGERATTGADDGKDNALVYQKLVASFSKMAGNEAAGAAAAPGGGAAAAGFGGAAGVAGGVVGGGVASASSTPHSSPPLFAKVMQHIGSRLVALMHEVSGGEGVATSSPKPRLHHHGHHHGHHHHHHHHHHHRRLQQKPSSASTTTEEEEEEDSSHTDTEQSPGGVSAPLLQLPRSKSHDLLLEQQQHEARLRSASSGGHVSDVERSEHSDYERFSWRGSFESALMAADSRTKLSLLAGAGGGGGGGGCGALPESCKRRSAGDLLLASSRDQLAVDRVRSCGTIGGLEEEQVGWRRRSSVPDAGRSDNTSADDEDDDDDDDVGGDEGGEERARSTTLPRSLAPPGAGTAPATSNSLPRLPPSLAGMHKAHSVHHLLQPAAAAGHVKSARYRPPGFVSRPASASVSAGPPPKRAVSAPGLHQPQPAPRANAPARRRPQPPTSLLPSGEELAAGEEAASTSATASLQRPLSKSATPSPVVGGAASRKNSTSLSVAGDFAAAAHDADDNKLRPGLSPLGARSDSLASVYSGAGEGRYGTVAVRGEVEFGLQYNYKAGALEILVKQCRDLAPVDTKRNRSDPYVKVYLLPDKSKSGKRKTKVKKHTLNPVFDETLKFHITLHGLETRTLWLTVWHSDMFGRNDFLGEVMMSLENKVFDDPTPQWYPLQERTEPFDDLLSYKGDIIIGLKFVPPDVTVQKKGKRSRGSLQVLVKEAKNLTAVKANGTSDPFCKSYLLPDKGRSSKQKTPVLRRTCNPVWNYTFAYEDVSLQELSERSLELTVWDHDRLASNEFLGGLRFNLGTGKHYGKSVDWMDATGKEMTLWQSMLERPNFWVEGCLTLRPSLEHRSTNS